MLAVTLLCTGDAMAATAAVATRQAQSKSGAAAAVPATRSAADSDGRRSADLPVLNIHVLKDVGGLPEDGPDAEQEKQFTEGLQRYMTEAAQGRYRVNSKLRRGDQASQIYTLDGDLSRTDSGKNGGAYLCVIRLYEEKPVRRVVAQWAGVADNYRFLYGSLGNIPGVNREGLLGELGHRIDRTILQRERISNSGSKPLESMTPESIYSAFDAFVDSASRHKRLVSFVVPDDDSGATKADGQTNATASIPAQTLVSGQKYRIRVASQDEGDVYVVGVGSDNSLRPLYVPEKGDEISVGPREPAVLPAVAPWRAERTDHEIKREIVVLVRRRDDDATAIRKRVLSSSLPPVTAPAPTAPSPTAPAPATSGSATLEMQNSQGMQGTASFDGQLPVRVLEAGSALPPEPAADRSLARLIRMFQSDPADTWTAQRVSYRIRSADDDGLSTPGAAKPATVPNPSADGGKTVNVTTPNNKG